MLQCPNLGQKVLSWTIPPMFLSFIRERRRLFRVLRRSGDLERRLVIIVDISNFDQIVKVNMHRFENDRYKDILEGIMVISKTCCKVKRKASLASRDSVSSLVDATGARAVSTNTGVRCWRTR